MPALAIAVAIVFISVGEGGAPTVVITGAGETQRLYGGILQDADVLGDPEAPVTITYYTDLQSERFAEYHFATIPPLVEGLVRDGDAKLAIRHFPTGENETQTAAFAATAAGEQARQWQFAHLFFLNLDRIPGDPPRLTVPFLRQIAAAVSVVEDFDESVWEDAIDSEEVRSTVESDAQEAIEMLLPAEPAIVVEGPGGTRELDPSPSVAEIEAAVAEVR